MSILPNDDPESRDRMRPLMGPRAAEMRRFNILDVIVLVAAIALGFALCRTTLRSYLPSPPRGLFNLARFTYVRDTLPYAAPVLVSSMIACLIMRLRGPRPADGRLFECPGVVAVVVVTCVIALEAALTVLQIAAGTRSDFLVTPFAYGFYVNSGYAVLGAWTELCLSGRWQFECSWIDWLGFALGLAWIGLVLAYWGSFTLIR